MTIGFYQVQSGDQLLRILHGHYGSAPFLLDRDAAMRVVLDANPEIQDPNRIYPNQIIMLPPLSGAGTAGPRDSGPPVPPPLPAEMARQCRMISNGLSNATPGGRDFVGSLNFLEAYNAAAGGFATFVEKATAASVAPAREIALQYYRKEGGRLTKNQYNYRRRLNVKTIEETLGPLQKLINPGKTVGEVLRVQPRAANRVSAILKEADQFARISKFAKAGGTILTVADLGATGFKLATADNDQLRTVIAIESVGTYAGQALGVGVALLIMGTPVGWLGIAVVAAAGAGGSLAGQWAAKSVVENTLFDKNGNRIDIAADHWWSKLKISK